MEYGKIEGIDKPISRLVQGTLMTSSERLEEGFALLDAVLAEGCTTFDTAHVYGSGDNERTVGRWIRERGIRDKVVLISKGAHHNADRQRVTPYDIEADLHDSFARFGFDYLDIYILHRDDPSQPVGPIVEILNQYQASGNIGVFGGSNWSHTRIEEANEYAYAHNLTPFTVSSPNFSLAAQHQPPWPNCISIAAEQGKDARAWYGKQHMALFTWSSLAGGFFSGRFRRDNLEGMESYFDKLAVESYCYEDNFQKLDRAELLAKQYQMTLPQIALAYVMSQPLNIFALVGCANVGEFRDNAAALALKLTPDQIAWLESGTPVPA
ncbi:MAG: aldo/keto reductase [Chloroflexi bacterium]|nr:aldo/keto reductase [Chloroflexota bacterium]